MNIRLNFDGAVVASKLGTDMGIGLAVRIDDNYEPDFCKTEFHKGWPDSSSNIAEWLGCVLAFKTAGEFIDDLQLDLKEDDSIEIVSDSQIITNQVNGEYQIKNVNFIPYFKEVENIKRKYPALADLKVKWVKRDFNKEADKLSKAGLKLNPNWQSENPLK